jgi:hypothetical protein
MFDDAVARARAGVPYRQAATLAAAAALTRHPSTPLDARSA